MISKEISDFFNTRHSNNYSLVNSRENGFKKAYKLFKKASTNIPAYKDFLTKNKINVENIKTQKDFQSVPVTTKENYIFKYDLKDRCWDSKLNNVHTIAASSGSTGEPVFWPREIKQEIEGAKIHDLLLTNVFDVSNKSTLFINAFGLGNWIAGMYTEFCVYLLRLKGIPFTLSSPGYNQEEIFKIVMNFSKFYDQTIIACHPPVIKMLIENGVKEKINWKKLNMKFLGAAEGFSENWRDNLMSLVGQKDPLKTIINIYGSADAGLMGFETPLSISLHRKSLTDHKLNGQLFKSNRNPYLYQFNPEFKYLETSNQGEITVTCDASAPLLRYNIHDKGGILEFSEYKKISKVSKKDANWNFPFVYVFGRDKFMVSLYGVNIYPENIKAALEHGSLQSYLTGRFIAEKDFDKNQDQHIVLRVELLATSTKQTVDLQKQIKKIFINSLRELNSEYRYVEERYKAKMHPEVILHKFQDKPYFEEGKIKKMA